MRPARLSILVCCALLAACGGDDKDEASGERTEQAWAAEVNAVCRDNQEATRGTADEVRETGLGQREATAEVLARSVPIERRLLARLGKVPAPAALERDYTRFLDRLGDTLPLLGQLATVVRENREDPELTTKLTKIAADTRPFATKHRLTACLPDAN